MTSLTMTSLACTRRGETHPEQDAVLYKDQTLIIFCSLDVISEFTNREDF